MKKTIIKILDKLEKNGFEAYIVGGYVRDYLLNKKSNDIDICTNAKPKEIIDLFNVKTNNYKYGSFNINNDMYNIDITTYRKETYSKFRKKTKIIYSDNLLDDLKRRDFTINSICMNKEGEIIDLLSGVADLNDEKIIVIGNTNLKLKEDPLRILRAIRFSATLGFILDKNIIQYINSNSKIIEKLSYNIKLKEIKRAASDKKALAIFKLYKKYNIDEKLNIRYEDLIKCNDMFGYLVQIEFSEKYTFTKNEKSIMNNIKTLIEYGNINNYTLFKYGLYINKVAGEVLGYDIININKMYNNLAIKTQKELTINGEDIIKILNLKPTKQVKVILDEITMLVVENKIKNNKDELLKYIKSR